MPVHPGNVPVMEAPDLQQPSLEVSFESFFYFYDYVLKTVDSPNKPNYIFTSVKVQGLMPGPIHKGMIP